jgi:hypothetical protein
MGGECRLHGEFSALSLLIGRAKNGTTAAIDVGARGETEKSLVIAGSEAHSPLSRRQDQLRHYPGVPL